MLSGDQVQKTLPLVSITSAAVSREGKHISFACKEKIKFILFTEAEAMETNG